MHLTLLVPGLLWPREILRDTTFDLPLPALSLLLGRGRHSPSASVEAWLSNVFGVDAPLPAAALRLLGDGGEPGFHDWLCLDPVHLRLEERAIVVDDPAKLDLSADEDTALREAVAPLFSPLGEISAPVPGRWHLRLTIPADIETQSLDQSVGRPADPMLPGGMAGSGWRRLLAEAQTLLHAHPVNRTREETGRAAVNSLWPWGPGRLPATAHRNFDGLWADEPVIKGLGKLASVVAEPPPARFTTVHGRVLARLDHLTPSLAAFDAMTWREALVALETDWLVPALATVKSGGLRRLTLVAGSHGRALNVTVGRSDLWRLWRKPLTLAELAP